MVEPLPLDTAQPLPQEQLLPFDVTQGAIPMPGEIAAPRAYKTKYGVPTYEKSYDQLYLEIAAGREQQIRSDLVSAINQEKNLRTHEILADVAKKKGERLTPQEVDMIMAHINRPTDPGSVIEDEYAKKYISELDTVSFMKDSILTEAKALVPETTEETLSLGRMATAKTEVAKTWLDNAIAARGEQSYIGYGVDQLKLLSTIYQEVKLRGSVPGTGFAQGGFLGENLEEQALTLLRMPYSQFKTEFERIMRPLIKDNPSLAIMFANAVLGQSSSERFLNNVFTPLVATGALTLGRLGKQAVDAIRISNLAKQAVKSAVKSNAEESPSKAAALEAAGDIREAGLAQGAELVVKQLKGSSNPAEEVTEGFQALFTGAVDGIKSNPGKYRQEFVNRLVESYHTFKHNFFDTLANVAKIERLPGLIKAEEALRAIAKATENDFPGLQNTILTVSTPRKVDPLSNLYYVDVDFGQTGAKLFTSERQAKDFARIHKLSGTTVEQKGLGFSLRVTHQLKETQDVVRDWLHATDETKTPETILNFFSKARTPEETLSFQQRVQRKIATYAPSAIIKTLKENEAEIKKLKGWNLPLLKKKRWTDFESVVSESLHERSPATGQSRFLFRSPGEFAEFFEKQKGYFPDEGQVEAYFAYKRFVEASDFLIKREKYKNLVRDGTESWTISTLDKARQSANATPIFSRKIQGVMVHELPNEVATVVIVNKNLGEETITSAHKIRGKWADRLKEEIRTGKKAVIKLTNPSENPMYGFGKVMDDKIRVKYVIAENRQRETLSWNDVKTQKFSDVDHDNYIAQAVVRKDPITGKVWYEGDRTIAAFNIRAMGKDVAEKLDQVRQFIKAGDIAAARRANPIPVDFDTVHKWFLGDVTKEGLPIAPKLSLDEPIRIVGKHQLIKDVDNDLKNRKDFADGTREGYGSFSKDRDPYDIFSIENEGTRTTPLYNVTPVRYVSPITAINRALKRAVQSAFMNDYKTFSIEHWVREAEESKLLNVKKEDLRENPFYHFYNPSWVPGADVSTKARLETANYQIKQFLGVQSSTDSAVHWVAQKLSDSIYNKTGGRFALVPGWLLPKLSDPFSFLRSITFHAKIGLFSIPQLLVQLQTYSMILGIAGIKYASSGSIGAMMHGYSRLNKNPAILDKLDSIATNLRVPGMSKWKPGEWKEARQMIEDTGFGNVAGEYIFRDNPMAMDVISSKGKAILDAGTWFFRTGERSVRYGAFYTAYREFRDKVPTGRLTEADRAAILERADVLSVNMSRASASAIHRGVFSIPTQFLAYQLRAAELFMGKRLTSQERARLMIVQGALYGIPAIGGLTGVPIGDFFQKAARENGYIVGENWITSAFHEGGIATLLAALTGNWYNVQERYSLQGFELLRDTMRSDTGLWEILGGASFSVIKDTLAGMDGFTRAMMSAIRDDDEVFKIKSEDFFDAFKPISAVANFDKLYAAINTGRWLTKKEAYISDTSMGNAFFMYLSGLQPSAATDLNYFSWIRKDEKEAQSKALGSFIKEFRRGLINYEDNPEQAKDFFVRAFVTLRQQGYPEEKIGSAIAIAIQGNETIVSRIARDFYTKDVPEYRKEIAEKAFERFLKYNDK